MNNSQDKKAYMPLLSHITDQEGEVLCAQLRRDLVEREAAHTGLPMKNAKELYVQMSIYIHGLAAVRAAHKAEFKPEEMEQMIVAMLELLKKAA